MGTDGNKKTHTFHFQLEVRGEEIVTQMRIGSNVFYVNNIVLCQLHKKVREFEVEEQPQIW